MMSAAAARRAVKAYYILQDLRIGADAQKRSSEAEGEPGVPLVESMANLVRVVEQEWQKMLGTYAREHRVGRWLQSLCGIGPVISAGLVAHIDFTKCQTGGALRRFAGLDPGQKWLGPAKAKEVVKEHLGKVSGKVKLEDVYLMAEVADRKAETLLVWMTGKGKAKPSMTADALIAACARRPWNADLKCLLAFKAGESFVKVQANEADIYGKLYAQRKAKEVMGNNSGGFADLAAKMLAEKNYRAGTPTKAKLEQGLLPDAALHGRARRYAVGIFVSHLQEVGWECATGTEPPVPYAFTHAGGDHAHRIEVPNWPCE